MRMQKLYPGMLMEKWNGWESKVTFFDNIVVNTQQN